MNAMSVPPSMDCACNTSRAPIQSTPTATIVPSTSVSGPDRSASRCMRVIPFE